MEFPLETFVRVTTGWGYRWRERANPMAGTRCVRVTGELQSARVHALVWPRANGWYARVYLDHECVSRMYLTAMDPGWRVDHQGLFRGVGGETWTIIYGGEYA
jgi:hypothetical protein